MFHAQNLNEDRDGKVKGSIFWHGRFWWGRLMASWKAFCRHVGFTVGVEEEDGLTFHLGVGLFSVWMTWKLRGVRRSRHLDLRFHDGAVWWQIWGDPNAWSKEDRWWQTTHRFSPTDFFLGRYVHHSQVIQSKYVLIPMPEGCYSATVQIHDDTWQRPRWPWSRTVRRATIDIPAGIPHEGKGENSWDCGEDGTWGLTTPANTVEEAIGKLVTSVLEDRKKYGTPARLKVHMADQKVGK